MRIEYQIDTIRIEANEDMLNYICTFYPLKEAYFIPFVKDEYRIDEFLKEEGDFNDSLIQEFLKYLEEFSYLATIRHVENYYSDYYENEDGFINVLFSLHSDNCYVEAIFYNSKLKFYM